MGYPAERASPANSAYITQAGQGGPAPYGKPMQVVGAVVSVALILGLGFWGYKLAVRDAAGIPVVRALEGPMREAPEKPGGTVADHQGLSVTQVAAGGTVGDPADEIAVADEMADLAPQDQPRAALRPEPRATQAEAADADLVSQDVTPTTLAAEPLPSDPVEAALALAEQLSEGAEPLDPQPEAEAAPALPATAIPASVPGVSRTPRPAPRPAERARPLVTEVTEVSAPAAPAEIAAADVPTGTRMVQLGAFDTPDDAATAWAVLSAQFDTMMADKTRVVQKAASGGRDFYRLRAVGFADLSDARRFCAALVAERADCIPVVQR